MAEAKEMARRHIEFFNQNRIDQMAPDWAEDIEFDSVLSGPLKGKQAVTAYWEQTKKTFPDARVEIKNAVGEGPKAAVEYVVTATNSGTIVRRTGETIPATNKKVRLPGIDFIELDSEGKLKKLRQYHDAMTIFQQLGLVPAEAAAARG